MDMDIKKDRSRNVAGEEIRGTLPGVLLQPLSSSARPAGQ